MSPNGREKRVGGLSRELWYRVLLSLKGTRPGTPQGAGAPAADSCWWLEPGSVCGFSPGLSRFPPSSLPVEATFRQMGGAPGTRERLPCGETLGQVTASSPRKESVRLAPAFAFSFSPFLSSSSSPIFNFQLPYFLFPVFCALCIGIQRVKRWAPWGGPPLWVCV